MRLVLTESIATNKSVTPNFKENVNETCVKYLGAPVSKTELGMEHRTCEYEDSLYLKGALDLEHMFKRWVGGYRRVGQCVFLPSLNKNNISRDVPELAELCFPPFGFIFFARFFFFSRKTARGCSAHFRLHSNAGFIQKSKKMKSLSRKVVAFVFIAKQELKEHVDLFKPVQNQIKHVVSV